jgi:hypothetical protein
MSSKQNATRKMPSSKEQRGPNQQQAAERLVGPLVGEEWPDLPSKDVTTTVIYDLSVEVTTPGGTRVSGKLHPRTKTILAVCFLIVVISAIARKDPALMTEMLNAISRSGPPSRGLQVPCVSDSPPSGSKHAKGQDQGQSGPD